MSNEVPDLITPSPPLPGQYHGYNMSLFDSSNTVEASVLYENAFIGTAACAYNFFRTHIQCFGGREGTKLHSE